MGAGFSLSLDIVRIAAATAVFLAHFSYYRISGHWLEKMWAAPFAHHAVMVFFVLSGIVIAYVASGREGTPHIFFRARAVRIYSVVLPTIILTPLLDWSGRQFDPALYDGWWYRADDPVTRIGAALFFLHEAWWTSTRYFSNGPYWSIAYEVWYYATFGALWFLTGLRRWLALAAILIVAGPKIFLLFPVWLLGVFVWQFISKHTLPPKIAAVVLVACVAGYGLYIATGAYGVLERAGIDLLAVLGVPPWTLGRSEPWLSYYVLGSMIAAAFIAMASLAERIEWLLSLAAPAIRWIAGATFTMYLMHYPLMQLAASIIPGDESNPYRAFVIFLTVVAGIFAIAEVTERRKHVFGKVYDSAFEKLGALARYIGAAQAHWRVPGRAR